MGSTTGALFNTNLSLFPAKLNPTPAAPFVISITCNSPGSRPYFFFACSTINLDQRTTSTLGWFCSILSFYVGRSFGCIESRVDVFIPRSFYFNPLYKGFSLLMQVRKTFSAKPTSNMKITSKRLFLASTRPLKQSTYIFVAQSHERLALKYLERICVGVVKLVRDTTCKTIRSKQKEKA